MQKNHTKKMAFSGIFCALGVAVLWIGRWIPALDLTICAMASLLILIACIELGYGYAGSIYAVTAILALLLTTDGQIGIYYLFLFGVYPIVKLLAQRLPKAGEWCVKLLFCNVMLALVTVLLQFLFRIFSAITYGAWYWIALWLLFNVVFVIYDIALTKLMRFYLWKLHKYFPKL